MSSPTRLPLPLHLPARLRRLHPRRGSDPAPAGLHGGPLALGAQPLVFPRVGRLAVEVPAPGEQGQAALPDDVVLVCVSQYRAGEFLTHPLSALVISGGGDIHTEKK